MSAGTRNTAAEADARIRRGKAAIRSREPAVRVGTAMAIPLVLRRLGAQPDDVFAVAGLDSTLFDDPDNLISFAARCRLLDQCVASTGCFHFGLLVGQEEGLQNLGAIGYLAQSSKDVREALQHICELMYLQAPNVNVDVQSDARHAIFRYEICEPQGPACDQTYDAAVAIMFNIMRSLCGEEWRPVSVRFSHRRPQDIEPYRRFFQAPLKFNAALNGLKFAKSWLDRDLPGFDPFLHQLMQKQVAELQAEAGDDLRSQVVRLLSRAVLSGRDSEPEIADAFDLNVRTLRRRLRESGTSFRELRLQSRFEIARQLLETSDMDVAMIAEVVGYANSSAFTRAFKRSHGMTPSDYRGSNGG